MIRNLIINATKLRASEKCDNGYNQRKIQGDTSRTDKVQRLIEAAGRKA